MKRLAPLLLALGCGGNEVRATNAPTPSAPVVPDAAPAPVTPIADAGTAPDDAAAMANPRDLLLGQMAALALKTIPSPPPPPHPPPAPPPTHDLEVRQMTPPLIYESTLRISDGLPFEIVRRILRQNLGRFRLCYETDLRREPTLREKVVVRFAIDKNGRVAIAEPAPSSTATPSLSLCAVHAVETLWFAEPDAPLVAVEYGLSFEP